MTVVDLIQSWLRTPLTVAYMIAAGISIVLAISEIVSVFERDPVRALKTWGAFMLLFLNAAFATILLAIVLYLVPNSNPFWTAIGVGVGLPVLLRTNFTLIKPFDGSTAKGVGITFDEMYGRLQGFCRRRVDIALAARRVRTVDQAIKAIQLSELAQRLRLLLEGGLLTVGEESQGYVDKIVNHSAYSEERKRMLLAFGILNFGGDRMLEEMLREARRTQKQGATKSQTSTSISTSQ